ncbi:MAG: four helix bundle protein [Deltaproteobacteria bacterium]|nr:four helix bundle protein [Deltaproteobacteria bacterium]
MRDHTKLRAFELADEVAVLVYRVTAGFSREELYGLTSQMRRAAVSAPRVTRMKQRLSKQRRS